MTHIPTAITHVLQSLGAATDAIDEVSFNDEDQSWAVLMHDGIELLVEWDDAPSRLMLSSLLGPAPLGREISLYAAALGYNAHDRDTGGVTVGLGGTGGELMLMRQFGADALLLQDLQAAVLDFHALTTAWIRHVAGDADQPPAVAALLSMGAPLAGSHPLP